VAKNDLVAEAERTLDAARHRLRAAAAFHAFALGGNRAEARRMREIAIGADAARGRLDSLADQYPAFERLGGLLRLVREAA
jgi:hypothetical protein